MRFGLLAMAALLSGAPVHAQQFTMKLSSPTINDVTHEWMKTFKTGVEARTAGKVKVEIYPANQLGQIPRTVEGVALGTIEMTQPAVGFFVGLEPRFEALEVPGLFESMEHANRVLQDPEVRRRLSSFGATKGIEPLYTAVHGPIMLVSHKAVRTIADLKGQKLRTPGPTPIHMEPMRRMGASPLVLPLGEVLPAMQSRTIDGAMATPNVFSVFKYFDVAKSLTYLPQSFLVFSGVVNRAWMKSLGPELEAMVRDEARKAESVLNTFGPADVEKMSKVWETNGGQNITLAPTEAKRYLDEVAAAVAPVLAKNPQVKEDYEAFLAAARRVR